MWKRINTLARNFAFVLLLFLAANKRIYIFWLLLLQTYSIRRLFYGDFKWVLSIESLCDHLVKLTSPRWVLRRFLRVVQCAVMMTGVSQQFCVRWNSHLGSLGAAFPEVISVVIQFTVFICNASTTIKSNVNFRFLLVWNVVVGRPTICRCNASMRWASSALPSTGACRMLDVLWKFIER